MYQRRSVHRRSCLLLRALFMLALLLCLAMPAGAQRGARTVPRNLAELVDQSERIVRGRVSAVRVEPHPELKNVWTILVTLNIEESFKGTPQKTLTFRQFIWDVRDRADFAGYKKGQHVLLLMNPPTPLGLSSPAGLDQGRFRIVRDSSGVEYALNGVGNIGLFKNIEPHLRKKGILLSPQLSGRVAQGNPGSIELRELKELVSKLAEPNK